MKGKNIQPRLPSKDLIDSREKLKFYRQAKAKRIQHHQTSFTTNAKGTSLGRKHKRRKRLTITNPKNKKMVIGTYISKTTLRVNGLNAPTKRHKLSEWIQKQDHIYAVYKRPTSNLGTHT